jgi:hypothetical protein
MLPSLRRSSLRTVALLAIVLPSAAACGGDEPVGPVATLPVAAAQLDALAATLEPITEQAVFDGFLLMRFGRGLPFDAEVFFPHGSRMATSPRASGLANGVAGQVVPRVPSIPDSLRGRTFVRDSQSLGWTLDRLADGTPRPGAPSNGLRFVLSSYFAPGPASSARVGNMDMTQQGTGAAAGFTVDARALSNAHVLHYAATLSGSASAGWVSHGDVRIDQVVTTAGAGSRRARWTGSGVVLDAERAESFGMRGPASITHTLAMDGRRLKLVSTMSADDEDGSVTYTVLAGDAPFARRTDAMLTEGAWRHIAGNRLLTEGELAQVRAFLRVLIAVPDAEAAWEQGVIDLFSLQYPSPF